MKKTVLVFAAFVLLISVACKKNQLGGSATIQGKVTHHSKPIPYARIFIKFKATEFPGRDTSVYDARIVTDASANYTIKCYKGDYYLFSIGYDDAITKNVYGGIPVHTRNHETVDNDVAVTED